MADERRIVIELKLNNSGSNNDEESKEDENLTSILKFAQHPIKSSEEALLGKNIIFYSFYQQAKQSIKSNGLYFINQYFNLTENYKAEQDLNNTLSYISNGASFFGSILASALIGGKAGHPVAGAIVGAGMGAVNVVLNSYKAYDQQNIRLASMNIQSNYQKVRLGLIDDGRGTQN